MIDNYITKEVSDGVAFLYLNQKDSKVNIVSPSLIDVFGQIIDQIISDDSIMAAVFISSKKESTPFALATIGPKSFLNFLFKFLRRLVFIEFIVALMIPAT